MLKIIRTCLIAMLAIFLLAGWHIYRSSAVEGSPFSQIYIHETPVCVFQEGENVLARVGMCPDATEGETPDKESFHGNEPFHGRPHMKLPPGHPPIDGGGFPEQGRIINI